MTEPSPPIVRSIYSVLIQEIDANGGLRQLDEAWVEGLAALMARDGQERPIEIYRTGGERAFAMIAGRHRLAAAKRLGWISIDADILDAKALDRRAREVSENLFRRALGPLDRAAFVAEQIAIERARAGVAPDTAPQSVAANARWSDRIGAEADDASANIARAYGFTDDIAEKVGLSRRAIYLDLELHRGLRPDVSAAIRSLAVASNASQLRQLARLPEAQQRAVAELLVEGVAKGVSDALATMRQTPVKSPAQKAVSAIRGNWGRVSARELKALIAELPMPAGVVVTIDGQTVGGGK